MNDTLHKLVGHFSFRPLVEHIAREGGLTMRHSPLDAGQRIDPLELARQKGERDFASKLIEDMGWSFEAMPPLAAPAPRQSQAESDGGEIGEGR